jgi:hypothetical protein
MRRGFFIGASLMAKPHIADVIYTTDDYGAAIALIPITNRPGEVCKMDKADWLAWCAAGRSQSLNVQKLGPHRYGLAYYEPASGRNSTNATVARAIVNPPADKAVFNLSRNIYDMRRRNLAVNARRGQGYVPA